MPETPKFLFILSMLERKVGPVVHVRRWATRKRREKGWGKKNVKGEGKAASPASIPPQDHRETSEG